jgi:hypothetical protein
MEYIYTPYQVKPWDLNPRKLSHRYFVQVSPDQQYLVPGSLQQGNHPPIGRWLEIGSIRKDLIQRYFVQQTDFNTLVPGLLIPGDEPPGDSWKDIVTKDRFYVFDFGSPYLAYGIMTTYTFVTSHDFMIEHVTPALDKLYPDRNPATPLTLKLYYFTGTSSELNNDPTLLKPFGSGNLDLGYFLTGTSTYVNTIQSTTTVPANLTIKPEAALGNYSVVIGIVGKDNEVRDYIMLDSLLFKTNAA